MKPYIHYNQKNHRGPGKVVENLLKGFSELGIEYVKKPGKADCYGCLQHPGQIVRYLPQTTLMGPNIFVLPNEASELVQQMKNFVVPSDWVKNLYVKFPEMKEKNIFTWSVGIDSETWKPSPNKPEEFDCFIYFKNRSMKDLKHVQSICDKLNLKTETISYGNYQEDQLKNLCERSRFAILLTDTESQGIAYMQILSMNVPCFVFEQNVWNYQNQFGNYQFPATSVPYFDQNCGLIKNINENNKQEIEDFINTLTKYNPRTYILNNHTLVHGAYRYLELLKTIK